MYILLTYDKIYYVIKKRGDDPNTYFIYKKHQLCTTHNSNTCGCKLNETKDSIKYNIEKYIYLYNSSNISLLFNKKVVYV